MELSLDNLKNIEWNKCGIYKLENIYSKKIYIGQAKDIRKRLRQHFEYLNANDYRRENCSLINAWIKYNGDCFKYEILEYCLESELNDKEIYWINYFDSYNNGYNQTHGGQYNFYKHEYSEEDRKILSNLHNPKPVLQIDLSGNVINEYWSVAHASKLNNIDSRGIYSCCNNGISKSSKGYIWIYKENYDCFDLEYYLNKKQKKQIEQYDLYGNLIKIWEHGCDVVKDGFKPSSVNSCCNHQRPSAHGYIWKFVDDDFIITEEYCKKIRTDLNRLKKKKIYQIDLDNNIINTFNSMREAVRLGYSKYLITKCINGLNDLYENCKWYFEEDWLKLQSSF